MHTHMRFWHVCMCACTFVSMDVCKHVCARVCACVSVCMHIREWACECVSVWACVLTHVRAVGVCVYACVCKREYVSVGLCVSARVCESCVSACMCVSHNKKIPYTWLTGQMVPLRFINKPLWD